MGDVNRLVIIGNGFDLAHGLNTTYKDFLDWYMCQAFDNFCNEKHHEDCLVEIANQYSNYYTDFKKRPNTFEQVLTLISSRNGLQSLNYKSDFFKDLLHSYSEKNWVDIETYYFNILKSKFVFKDNHNAVLEINTAFDFLIVKLSEYINHVNTQISEVPKLNFENGELETAFMQRPNSNVKFLNFNYTETLVEKNYANEKDIIHIHGRAADKINNPIIFGYGDESDPTYQKIEDSGDNILLDHIKSFGYFKTNNYRDLISYIDSHPYVVYIIGHSCGLSDRILLREIFEHRNCSNIEIFYHEKVDGSNNFKEITQEISRHFRPENKSVMRRKVVSQNIRNIIPQNNIRTKEKK